MNKIPFQIRGVLRRTRPVQAEQNAIEFIGICEERKEFPFQFFVRLSFNHAARASARIYQWHRFAVLLFENGNHPSDDAGVLGCQLFTVQQLGPLERGQVRQMACEMVALDEYAAYADPGHNQSL
jgi:hypothetical protein